MIDLPENELVHLAQGPEATPETRRRAENELVSRFDRQARNLAQAVTSGHAASFDDAHQEALIGTWRAVRKYDPAKGKFTTFAWRCAGGYAGNEARKFTGTATETNMEYVAADTPGPEVQVARSELAREVKRLVNSSPELDELDRAVFYERILNPMKTLEAIARAYGKSQNTVQKREAKLLTKVLPRILVTLRSVA